MDVCDFTYLDPLLRRRLPRLLKFRQDPQPEIHICHTCIRTNKENWGPSVWSICFSPGHIRPNNWYKFLPQAVYLWLLSILGCCSNEGTRLSRLASSCDSQQIVGRTGLSLRCSEMIPQLWKIKVTEVNNTHACCQVNPCPSLRPAHFLIGSNLTFVHIVVNSVDQFVNLHSFVRR